MCVNFNKDNALREYLAMTRNSWTYNRMTEGEKRACIRALEWAEEQGALKGPAVTRWHVLQAVYNAYLAGLGYSGPGWREDRTGVNNEDITRALSAA